MYEKRKTENEQEKEKTRFNFKSYAQIEVHTEVYTNTQVCIYTAMDIKLAQKPCIVWLWFCFLFVSYE